jgi:hypothetical protein
MIPPTCYLLYSLVHLNNLTIVLFGFAVLSAAVLVGVAAAVNAFLVVGKKEQLLHIVRVE